MPQLPQFPIKIINIHIMSSHIKIIWQYYYQQSDMTDYDMEAMMALFNNHEVLTNKKLKYKKQSFLLKFNLFTLIFQKKGQLNFRSIVDQIKLVQYGFGYQIFNEAIDRNFIYIVQGLVMVFLQKSDQPTSAPSLYRKMGPNQHFGEKFHYSNNQKLHSARAVSKTYVLSLDLETFYKTFSGHFKYQQLTQKVNFLQGIWIFSQTTTSQIERILMLSKPCRYQKNSIVFKEGDEPEAVYVVIEGELTLYKRDSQVHSKYLPFMILGKKQICGCEEIIQKKPLQCGGVITSSEALLLRINRKLFQDIFADKITEQVINQRNDVKQKLIEVKSKKSIDASLQKLKQTQKLLEQKNKPKFSRTRYRTQPKKMQLGDIFDITQGSISWQNRLKNKKLRQFVLKQRTKTDKQRMSSMRLSTMTNNSFTNDKQLLLSYLIRKQRTDRKAEDWERAYEKQTVHSIKQLIVQRSSAVKTQKRKLRQSRRKNATSMPTLL